MAVMTASAQFDPQLGQYMYMPTAYNPAAVGEGDLMKVAGVHRMQFVDISNAPMSTWFSFCSPFVIGKTSHGAGVRFIHHAVVARAICVPPEIRTGLFRHRNRFGLRECGLQG